jgi:hypothetical protein
MAKEPAAPQKTTGEAERQADVGSPTLLFYGTLFAMLGIALSVQPASGEEG